MGVERAVTRWYVQRQSLLAEIASLEAQLVQGQPSNDIVQAKERLAQAQEKLRRLGPSPQPKMG
ncbi:MAG: hypothetical protein WCD86_18830 [Ktedonobacteraceae bacterium]